MLLLITSGNVARAPLPALVFTVSGAQLQIRTLLRAGLGFRDQECPSVVYLRSMEIFGGEPRWHCVCAQVLSPV